jgi:2-(1,2-epoxy-1,2-dihydrophenyl)acetyl-CoA isomerase
MMSYESIRYEIADGIGTITLNRPQKFNAITNQILRELRQALESAGNDNSVRCLVLTGAGSAFCAGQDLNEIPIPRSDADAAAPINTAASLEEHLHGLYHPVILGLRNLEKPVIAAVNGVAAGAGCSLALAADLRIAADNASFIQAFSRIGLIPDSGSTYFLPRLIGLARTFEMIFTGDAVSAQDALQMGIVNRVVPTADLLEVTHQLALRLAQGPTRALGLAKRAVNVALNGDLQTALNTEAHLQVEAAATHDAAEGISAFLQKRKARFQGQ